MSVVSSRISSVSSILKGSGVRASTLLASQKKICFKLPDDITSVITNYENGSDHQTYGDMICILRDSNVKDLELVNLLKSLKECVLLMGPKHKLLVEVLLNLNWTSRSAEIIENFERFFKDLVCVHILHLPLVIEKLVKQFKIVDDETPLWTDGKCPESYKNRMEHVHNLIKYILKIIPMSNNQLIESLRNFYPYVSEGLVVTQQYVFALFQIIDYAPFMRKDILFLIINRFVLLDTSVKLSEIQKYDDENNENDYNENSDEENEEVFQMDESMGESNTKCSNYSEMNYPGAKMLDMCMEQLLAYVYDCCHIDGQVHVDSLRSIYNDLIHAFEKIILPTDKSSHIQFVMFYFCSFKPAVAETFTKWLWEIVSNPSKAPIIRQIAVSYISSLLARAKFIPVVVIQNTLVEMSAWIHSYISSQEMSLECVNSDVRVHTVFYSVCQAMFYLLAFRHKDIIDTKKSLLILQGLNLNKIVNCKLNPLKFCQTAVIQNFAAVTRNYQLAYCYPIIERNSRSNLPIIHTTTHFVNWLDMFFPFDPYLLTISGQRIEPFYNFSSNALHNIAESTSDKEKIEEEDDFMEDSFITNDVEANRTLEQSSYGTSPGFMY
ncbi:RNA polymerase I-specific transcription initiation factor RRN3 [Trichogramma pretiosum]|uniref:RNA polymerase I-specific transcription initiation factor RRN3 n=1 Tax=Trichogramma pretiosum TaxID=7493 RepID=UPI0006C9BC36|nr:RNA polymerase I-specific transcription initiation factor RRN3 [Trichogramma pretiosum]